jgi:hypothetical protein
VDSGCDEFYPQCESVEEVYATNEAVDQSQENYGYAPVEEWNAIETHPNTYVANEPVLQYAPVQQQISQQQYIDNRAIQTYDDLVKSPFVDELCLELDQWSNDPCFAQEMEAEKAAIVNTEEYNQATNEMTNFDDMDLFEFCNF